MARVSIVTISFNQGQFLEQAIRSVLEQDYSDLEYIVVDAGSTDGSRDIIERYRDRVTRIILEPDDGPADGLNKGFACASGDIFGYLNADDVYLPGAVREAVAVIEGGSADLVYADGYFIDESGGRTRRCLSTPYNFRRLIFGGMLVVQQSTFFRASAYRETGGFNPRNHSCWDGELFFQFAVSGKQIVRVKRFWSEFRLHRSSLTGSGANHEPYLRDSARMYEQCQARYGHLRPIIRIAAKIESRLVIPDIMLMRLRDRLFGGVPPKHIRSAPVVGADCPPATETLPSRHNAVLDARWNADR